jgi:hypothetical protein
MENVHVLGGNDVPYVVVDNWYSEDELKFIWMELDLLTNPDIMMAPSTTGSAITATGVPIKQNRGVFLESLYGEKKNLSFIVNSFVDKMANQELKMHIAQQNWFLAYLCKFNLYSSLVSYYEHGDSYLPHSDESLMTMCIHLYKEPKKFTGGELTIADTKLSLVNNRMVLFPSIAKHSVSTVKFDTENDLFSGDGRYTITYFLDYNFDLVRKHT